MKRATRDITRLGGFGRAMPVTFAAGLLAALSMGGCRCSSAFSPRKKSTRGLRSVETWPMLLAFVAIAGNALMFAIAFMVGLKPFIGTRRRHAEQAS